MSYSNNPSPECPGPNCQMCNGEMCGLCGAGCWDTTASKCEHGSIDRHADPMFGPASTPVQTLPVADPRDARIALLEKALAELSEASEAFLGFNRTPQGCAGWVLDKVVAAKRVLNGGT